MLAAKPETIFDVLEAVDAKLSSEDKWTKEHYARTSNGTKCSEDSPLAVCYCIVGATIAASPDAKYPCLASEAGTNTLSFMTLLLKEEGETSITKWNDAFERTFLDVKRFLNRAKDRAKHV